MSISRCFLLHKRTLACLFIAQVMLGHGSQASLGAGSRAPRPNILLILADDLGYSDLGCYGSEIATPNIDGLAKQGVRFTEFYNNCRCCPSRASLLTGRYPHQVGIGAMIDGYAAWIRNAADSDSYQDHLSPASPTLPEVLRSAGYRTLMCGKWHLGERPQEWPSRRGFERSFALIPGAMNYFGGESTGPRAFMTLDDQRFIPPQDGFYATDDFTTRAIDFLQNRPEEDNRPFFLYMAYNAPHWPLQARPEEIDEYRGAYDAGWQAIRQARMARLRELGIVDDSQTMAPMDRGGQPPWNKLAPDKREEWALRMSIFAAQVTRLDYNVGRLVQTLDEIGAADDTLVIVISDNGGAPEDPHRGRPGAPLGSRDSFWGYDRPWATVSNTPWRRHKVTPYEGGISSPAVIRWPAEISVQNHGGLVHGPAHILDVMPTLLELAGATFPRDAPPLEGRSIASMFRGKSAADDRTFCWEHQGNRAIRSGQWKLVQLAESDGGWELYDIAADRTESRDLADDRPELVRELSAEYDRWAERCGVVPWNTIIERRDQAERQKSKAKP